MNELTITIPICSRGDMLRACLERRYHQKHALFYIEKYLPLLLLLSRGLEGTPRAQEEDSAHAPIL